MVQMTSTVSGRRRKNWRNSFRISARSGFIALVESPAEAQGGEGEHGGPVDQEEHRGGLESVEPEALQRDPAGDLHVVPGREQVAVPLEEPGHGLDGEEKPG